MESLMFLKNKCQAHFLGDTSPNLESPPLTTKEDGKTRSNSVFHAYMIESALVFRMNPPQKPTEHTFPIMTGTTGSEVRIPPVGPKHEKKRPFGRFQVAGRGFEPLTFRL